MRIFNDPGTESEFRRKGYVVRPFLDESQIGALRELHERLNPQLVSDFYSTARSGDFEYRQRVYEGISSVMGESAKKLIPDYRSCMAAFVTKRAHTQSGRVWLHQDYSFVDPGSDVAVHIWCPLTDVDEQNGCLKVVVASHSFMSHISATPGNPSPFGPVSDMLDAEFTTQLPMAAGSALIYDGRLLHASDENLSGQQRIACGCALIPRLVSPKIYTWDETRPNQLDQLEVSDTFLTHLRPGTAIPSPYPDGVTYLESIDYVPRTLGTKDLAALRRLQREVSSPAPSVSLWRRPLEALTRRVLTATS